MPTTQIITDRLQHTESYLTQWLLPFWMDRSPDFQRGGFLTHFDTNGKPTGNTTKTFLSQIRMLFTMSSAHCAGYGEGRCAELAKHGADFILEHFWDEQHEGWNWIADGDGQITFDGKVGYGQCFGIYAFSEYFLATGDPRGREAADRTYAAVCKHMADSEHGGYFEIMKRDWQPEEPGRRGGDRKSFDVHMHMMEAMTTYYEMTGSPTHRRRLLETIALLTQKMLHPQFGTGYMQFASDFTPLRAIRFDVEWGSDEEPDAEAFPLDWTSYGHNIEFAWLLMHAADVLGEPRESYSDIVRKITDHCLQFGIDEQFGGLYVDGPANAATHNCKKQFWQHAEALVGLLDAYALLGDEKYLQAFTNVHDFVFDKFINRKGGGEWYALLDRRGKPIWDYLGHEWKISYHTVRSMIQTVRRLRMLGEGRSKC